LYKSAFYKSSQIVFSPLFPGKILHAHPSFVYSIQNQKNTNSLSSTSYPPTEIWSFLNCNSKIPSLSMNYSVVQTLSSPSLFKDSKIPPPSIFRADWRSEQLDHRILQEYLVIHLQDIRMYRKKIKSDRNFPSSVRIPAMTWRRDYQNVERDLKWRLLNNDAGNVLKKCWIHFTYSLCRDLEMDLHFFWVFFIFSWYSHRINITVTLFDFMFWW
jgi:hypothetical protein